MKMIVLVAGIIAAFASCDELQVTFAEPQPADARPLKFFPSRIKGRYLADDQNSTLIINDKSIVRDYDFGVYKLITSLGSHFELRSDSLVNNNDGTWQKVKVDGDSVTLRVRWTDTLFIISPCHILTKFRGCYFLNDRLAENAWEVKRMEITRGILTVSRIGDLEDLKKLVEIAETNSDTILRHFSPTRRQFRKFVGERGFGENEVFSRID